MDITTAAMRAINAKFSMGGPSVNMPYVLIVQKAVLPTTPSIYHSPVKAVITPITIVLTPSSKRDTILTLVAQALVTTIGMSTKLVLTIYTPHQQTQTSLIIGVRAHARLRLCLLQ